MNNYNLSIGVLNAFWLYYVHTQYSTFQKFWATLHLLHIQTHMEILYTNQNQSLYNSKKHLYSSTKSELS